MVGWLFPTILTTVYYFLNIFPEFRFKHPYRIFTSVLWSHWFCFYIWRNWGTEKLRELQTLGSNPELLSSIPQLLTALQPTVARCSARILLFNKPVQTKGSSPRFVDPFLPWSLLTASSSSCPKGKAILLQHASSALGIYNRLYNCFY